MTFDLENFKKSKGVFTCKALFAGSVSSEHPEGIINNLFHGFLNGNNGVDEEAYKNQVEELVKKFKRGCSESNAVKQDALTSELLKKWVEQDLCFSTKKYAHLLRPLCLNVVNAYPFDTRENYAKHFFDLLRAGRYPAHLNVDEALAAVYESFKEKPDDPASGVMTAAFRLEAGAIKDWKLPENAPFKDKLLCSPHCRLLQEDIIHLLKWEMSRTLKLNLIRRILLYHFCVLYVRMSFLVDYLARMAVNMCQTVDPYVGVELPCVACKKRYDEKPDSHEELATECSFHPSFSFGEKSQKWYDGLIRYHQNIAILKLFQKCISSSSLDTVDEILGFLSLLKGNKDKLKECQLLLIEFMKKIEKDPPKDHAWAFFSRYAANEQATSFATRAYKGRFELELSQDLLMAWSHIFISVSKEKHKTPLFIDFLAFLDARGIKTPPNEIITLEKKLSSLGVLRHYADMGTARELEPTLPELGRGNL